MAGRDWDTRWDETIKYLDAVTTTGQVGTHIASLIKSDTKRKAISKQLSLGSRPDGEDDPGFSANTDKRHALRALLLCQRVYYSGDTWGHSSEAFGNTETVGLVPCDSLQADWKNVSLTHWKTKSETDIRDGIKMFEILPGARAVDVQNAAYTGRPNGTGLPGNLKVSRAGTETVGAGSSATWESRMAGEERRPLQWNCAVGHRSLGAARESGRWARSTCISGAVAHGSCISTHGGARSAERLFRHTAMPGYTLNRMCMMSPSATT